MSSKGRYEESWEPDVAQRILNIVKAKEEEKNASYPYCMIALTGIPGSGKTISSFLLANILETHNIKTTVLPHDGYHHFLEHLKTFPDAEDAIYRRGAPDTFDPQALLRDLKLIRDHEDGLSSSSDVISLPGFDHAKGDPEPNVHTFDPAQHKVVICEGLYLMHDGDGWEDIASLFDLKIFMEADVDDCVERLKIRNQCIPGYTPEEIEIRCEKVDRVNAMTVARSKSRADVVVKAQTNPVRNSEKPDIPSDQFAALKLLEQKDLDEIELQNTDWTMDIASRPNTNLETKSRSNSIEQSVPRPSPASQFVGTWEPEMADRIIEAVKKVELDPTKLPYMVALVGGPGSGKSVSAMLLASILEEKKYATMVCPHDGYHYTLEFLKTFTDADEAIYRRGAPDTFDPASLLRDLKRIKSGEEEVVKLPAFDHATGDPEPDTHIFDRQQHKIVLCEGLYLLHDQDGWEDIASTFDLKIFMKADVDNCIERVKIRNRCIPGYTPEEIDIRCEKVDRVNAMTVLKSQARADVVVDSMASKK